MLFRPQFAYGIICAKHRGKMHAGEDAEIVPGAVDEADNGERANAVSRLFVCPQSLGTAGFAGSRKEASNRRLNPTSRQSLATMRKET